MQVDAVEISIRATRKLGLLIDKQRKTVGLAQGGGDQRSKHRGARRPGGPITYKDAGIKPYVAKEANWLAEIPDEDFERLLGGRRHEMLSSGRVTKLIRRQHRINVDQREEIENRARAKGTWMKEEFERLKATSASRDEIEAYFDLTSATSDWDETYPPERRLSRRELWERRLASNASTPGRPKTIDSVHKIVADALARLMALIHGVRPRSERRYPKTAADYECVLQVMDQRIDELYEALDASPPTQPESNSVPSS